MSVLDEVTEAAAVAGIVERPRLHRVLDSPLVRVCVVQGPSGSGKTTLLRSWASRQDETRVVWISLSDEATSRQMFWQHVAASAQRMGVLSAAVAERTARQLAAAVDPVRLASALLADAGPVVLVFDAYEHLGDVMAEIDHDLARLVVAVPQLRIIVTTRAATGLTEIDAPDGVVRVVTLGELSLTPDEIGALLLVHTGIADATLAQSIATATRGFALTVRAVVLALSQLGRIPSLGSMEWDTVAASKLESLLPDADAVRFVTDTSVPPYVDVALAERLSESTDAARLFAYLERNGFGRWIPYARERPVFQYVETIRDTFRARAAADAERFARSCALTAQWLFDNEEVDQALMVAIEGGDYAFAERIFVPLIVNRPDTYITTRFLRPLQRVPERVLAEHPMLAFGRGVSMLPDPILRLEAPAALRIAFESTARPSYLEPEVDAFALAGMRAVTLRLMLRFAESADAALDAVRMAEELPRDVLSRHGELVGTVVRQLSYSLFAGGRIDDALAAMDRSVTLCTSQTARNYSLVYAAGASAVVGDVMRSRVLLAAIDRGAWPRALRDTSMNGLGLVAEAYARLDLLDFAGALDTLRAAQPFMQTVEYWPFLTAAAVVGGIGLGRAAAEAQRVARELSSIPRPGVGDNIPTEHLHCHIALAWLAGGDQRAAARALDGLPEASPHVAAARVAVLLGAERDRE
ncbi:MAG: NACHT domain-containing protein, partial [Microbacterium sp.]